MKFKLLLVIVCTALFFSCSSDDDTTTATTVNEHPIAGVWKMVTVSCFCAPPNFQADHIWNFDLALNELTVENEQDEYLQIFENGSYDFVLNTETIILQDLEYDYYFQENRLFIGHNADADGPLMIFERE
ncbi:hypothetical protein [Kordia jejudonensis]|uniref:hypothetical protein n=1 Tax=Kordia jejudonensis TaxID=1348245 RepID=UPI000629836D|nr:hypothetical protein [Kordia jejudonensis]